MAKLNKSEIEAIANKAREALEAAAKVKVDELREKYIPNKTAKALLELVKQREEKIKLASELHFEIDLLRRQIDNILRSKYKCVSYDYSYDTVFMTAAQEEYPIPIVPSKESIIDDITIAAIDKDFDTTKFIEDLVAKFNA